MHGAPSLLWQTIPCYWPIPPSLLSDIGMVRTRLALLLVRVLCVRSLDAVMKHRSEPGGVLNDDDVIFKELRFRNLTVKNRLFRSSISGRWDNYKGHGNQARINWEEKFARGGIGAIITSFVPVHVRGGILPNYAMIDHDDKIPFWRALGRKVHGYDCKYILQLSHSGRQRDVPGVENLMNKGLSSTSRKDSFHGLLSQAMTINEIKQTQQHFADGARRARDQAPLGSPHEARVAAARRDNCRGKSALSRRKAGRRAIGDGQNRASEVLRRGLRVVVTFRHARDDFAGRDRPDCRRAGEDSVA